MDRAATLARVIRDVERERPVGWRGRHEAERAVAIHRDLTTRVGRVAGRRHAELIVAAGPWLPHFLQPVLARQFGVTRVDGLDDLLRIKGGGLLSEVDVAVNLADLSQHRQIRDAM